MVVVGGAGAQITTTGIQLLLIGKGRGTTLSRGVGSNYNHGYPGIQFLSLGMGRDKNEYQHQKL